MSAEKRSINTRIVAMNANSFSCKNEEKIDQMIKFCKNNKIGMSITSETNCKWTTRNKDLISYKIRALGREERWYHADSKSNETTTTDWSQGGLMNVTTGRP